MLELIRWDDTIITIWFEWLDWAPINLTGCEVYFTMKNIDDIDERDDSTAIIKKTVSSFDNAVWGIVSIELDNQETDLEPWVYFYDVQLKDISNKIMSIQKQRVKVIQDVTKDPQLAY
jgi:hypothetical protein